MAIEFDLIQQYFTRPTRHTDLGVGDDAALIKVADGMQLVVSTDMSVAGTHFFADAAPYDIGWKALAVNVSDMAAMGAQAKWATLAIALPQILPSPSQGEGQDGGARHATPTPPLPLKEGGCIDEHWLVEFSRGFFDCADAFNIDLIGGDTTRGPLNISVTIMGEVPIGEALRRDGAKVGDDIWVSGTLGDAALALAILQNKYKIDINWQEDELGKWLPCLNRPQPRAALGLALRGIATSCIDISDGLLADLGHILTASNLGAELHLEKLPVSLYNLNHLHEPVIQQCILAGGDDYELCFTASPNQQANIEAIAKQQNLLITCIASTSASRSGIGLQAMYKNTEIKLNNKGFDHFG
jgi:thiamine-monophosphate kinase